MVEPRWSVKCMNSTLSLLNPSSSYTDLRTLHKKHCKKYICLCRRHTISAICINESRKLYWFNCKNVREKVNFGFGDGYYYKLLRIVDGALNTWLQHYIDGLSVTRREIMYKINGTAKTNMKLLKEGCYCHYHPHMTADACNADFLKKVVSFWAGEGFRGLRDKLRGMTNYAKKVDTSFRVVVSLFSAMYLYFLLDRCCLFHSCSLSPTATPFHVSHKNPAITSIHRQQPATTSNHQQPPAIRTNPDQLWPCNYIFDVFLQAWTVVALKSMRRPRYWNKHSRGRWIRDTLVGWCTIFIECRYLFTHIQGYSR